MAQPEFERRGAAFKALWEKLNELLAATTKTFKTAPINCGSSGANEIVAAVSGKRIKVYAIVFIATGTVTAKWQSDTADLTGDKSFQAREGYAVAVNPPAFLLGTEAGKKLNLYLSAAVAVDGWVAYWDDDAT